MTDKPNTRAMYECGICSSFHPWEFGGDCRDNANRWGSPDDYAEARGIDPDLIDVRSMDERVAADLMLMRTITLTEAEVALLLANESNDHQGWSDIADKIRNTQRGVCQDCGARGYVVGPEYNPDTGARIVTACQTCLTIGSGRQANAQAAKEAAAEATREDREPWIAQWNTDNDGSAWWEIVPVSFDDLQTGDENDGEPDTTTGRDTR